jgi:lysophospholipase L1-like esterase
VRSLVAAIATAVLFLSAPALAAMSLITVSAGSVLHVVATCTRVAGWPGVTVTDDLNQIYEVLDTITDASDSNARGVQQSYVWSTASGSRTVTATFASACRSKGLIVRELANPATNKTVTVMPLGDSITDGYPGTTGGWRSAMFDRWPNLVSVGSINDDGSLPAREQNHEGHGGFKSADIDSGINTWYTANPAQIVLLMAGRNDMLNSVSTSTYVTNMLSVVSKIKAINSGVVIVVGKMIYENPSQGSDATTDTYRNALSTGLVGVTRVVETNFTTIPGADYADLVHPSDVGYDLYMAPQWAAGLVTAYETFGLGACPSHSGRTQTTHAGTDGVATSTMTPAAVPAFVSGVSLVTGVLPGVGTGFAAGAATWSWGTGTSNALPEQRRTTSAAVAAATWTASSGTSYSVGAVFTEYNYAYTAGRASFGGFGGP